MKPLQLITNSYWDEFQGEPQEIRGIKRLAYAMIVRSILDSKGHISAFPEMSGSHGQAKEIVRTSIEWLLKSENIEPPSFFWCCEALNIEPRKLRDYLLSPHNAENIQRFLYSKKS